MRCDGNESDEDMICYGLYYAFRFLMLVSHRHTSGLYNMVYSFFDTRSVGSLGKRLSGIGA